MKRLQKFFILSVLLCALFSFGLSQGEETKPLFDIKDAIVLAIMSIGGIGVIAITQFVKSALVKLFNVTTAAVKDIIGYAGSLVVSAGASAYVLLRTQEFTWMALLGYTIYVWLEANQIFKVFKKPTPTG